MTGQSSTETHARAGEAAAGFSSSSCPLRRQPHWNRGAMERSVDARGHVDAGLAIVATVP
jgi:hypothetical protein